MNDSSFSLKYYTEYLPRISTIIVCFQPNDNNWKLEDINLVNSKHSVLSSSQKVLYSSLEVTFERSAENRHHIIQRADSIPLPVNVSQVLNDISLSSVKFIENLNDKSEIRSYSLRLKVETEDKNSSLTSRSENYLMSSNSHYKWNAQYLDKLRTCHKDSTNNPQNPRKFFILRCSSCSATIIHSDKIKYIRELPSEIWSELMEFWHCHKPHNNEKQDTKSNNYSASVLKPMPFSMNVGVYYFSINDKDFNTTESFTINANDKSKQGFGIDSEHINFRNSTARVTCSTCNKSLGELDFKNHLMKLFKWNFILLYGQTSDAVNIAENFGVQKDDITMVSNNNLKTLQGPNLVHTESFNAYCFAYSSIIDSINSMASRVFEVSINESDLDDTKRIGKHKKLYIWAFNTSITSTITNYESKLENCLKLYYSLVTHKNELPKKLPDIEELELPKDVYLNLLNVLQDTNSNLPSSSKKLNDFWNLGLLPFDD